MTSKKNFGTRAIDILHRCTTLVLFGITLAGDMSTLEHDCFINQSINQSINAVIIIVVDFCFLTLMQEDTLSPMELT